MMTLKMIALTRIVSRSAHIPASTAIGSLHGRDERPRALAAGANVLMPNFTPMPYRQQYEIYPNKRCVNEKPGDCGGCMQQIVAAVARLGRGDARCVDYSRGDSRKRSVKFEGW
jgi:biotin synthase